MNQLNARERILEAALKIFAEKSFEGSRIDEIAREANVPKSLIYYHFKSKNEILETLTANLISEYQSIIAEIPKQTHQEKAAELADRMKNVYFEFGKKNADLIRVIFIESLKKGKKASAMYEILDVIFSKEVQENTITESELQERRVVEFFTSFIPNYAYLCFADSWTEYFKIDRESFDRLYLKAYEETHGAYHKNRK